MKSFESNTITAFLVFILLFIITILVTTQQWFLRADLLLFDHQARIIASQNNSDEQIVVIAIDDQSIEQMEEFAGRWVWPRSVHAELLEGLQPYQSKAIAFDILFSEKDLYRPDADKYFNEVLSEHQNVFFSMLALKGDQTQGELLSSLGDLLPIVNDQRTNLGQRALLLLPKAIDKNNWQLGTINFTEDLDGVGRYYNVYQEFNQWGILALAAHVAIKNGAVLPQQSRILLNWRSNKLTPYQTFSYADVYRAVIKKDDLFLKQFEQKVIFIGATAAGLYDARATPIDNSLPGVYMLATSLDNLLNNNFYNEYSEFVHFLFSIMLITLVFLCFYNIRHYSYQLIVGLVLISLGWLVSYFVSLQLMMTNQVIFISSPLILMTFSFVIFALVYGYQEFINRKKALSTFGRFLDPKVVLKLLSQGQLEADFLNQKVTLTILFSDIRGFTTLSEKHDVQQVLTLLNDYFSKQVSAIFSTNGTLDKFIGDCIMAFWGAPIPNQSQAKDAIEAALVMQENLLEFKLSLPEHLQAFDIGIGIHTGEVIAGLVGTEQRVDYTVIGDAVNLASRIEGLTKNLCRILVSEQTMLLAKQDYQYEFMGNFEVKGRKENVNLYKPLRK